MKAKSAYFEIVASCHVCSVSSHNERHCSCDVFSHGHFCCCTTVTLHPAQRAGITVLPLSGHSMMQSASHEMKQNLLFHWLFIRQIILCANNTDLETYTHAKNALWYLQILQYIIGKKKSQTTKNKHNKKNLVTPLYLVTSDSLHFQSLWITRSHL